MMFLIQVSSQVVVPEGQNALLPCVYTWSDLPSQPTVIWIDPEERVLLTLTQGKLDILRTNVNMLDNMKGNFSMQIKEVTKAQMGIYRCSIREVDYVEKIFLKVTDKAVKTEVGSQGGAPLLHSSWPALVLTLCVFTHLI